MPVVVHSVRNPWALPFCLQSLVENPIVTLRFSRSAFETRKLHMRQRFEGSCHNLGYRPAVAEYLVSDLESCLRPVAYQVEHLSFAILMMLDDLVRPMPMIVVDAAVRGQHKFHVELLNLLLRIDKVAQRVHPEAVRVDSDVRRYFR